MPYFNRKTDIIPMVTDVDRGNDGHDSDDGNTDDDGVIKSNQIPL